VGDAVIEIGVEFEVCEHYLFAIGTTLPPDSGGTSHDAVRTITSNQVFVLGSFDT
jgi:hypothetical protein